jgi:hypothetical protein
VLNEKHGSVAMSNEFKHYDGCDHHDPNNCSACALTVLMELEAMDGSYYMGLNYTAWPLAYMDNLRTIPREFYPLLLRELESTNERYVANLKEQLARNDYDIDAIRKEVEDGLEGSKPGV